MLIRILFLLLLSAETATLACAVDTNKSSSEAMPELIAISYSYKWPLFSGSDTAPCTSTPPKKPGSLLRAFVAHLESPARDDSSTLQDKPSTIPTNDNEELPRYISTISDTCKVAKRHRRK